MFKILSEIPVTDQSDGLCKLIISLILHPLAAVLVLKLKCLRLHLEPSVLEKTEQGCSNLLVLCVKKCYLRKT